MCRSDDPAIRRLRSSMMDLSIFLSSKTLVLERGIVAALLAVVLTLILEMTTAMPEVRRLRSTHSGRTLYRSAIWTNIFNNLVLDPATYYFTIKNVCREGTLTFMERLAAVLGILVVEGVLYYWIHKGFHEVKGLYWIHRYHHKFHAIVVPSSANAVSVTEYVAAYMLPIVAGVSITRADEVAAFSAAAIIAVTNLLIHTPSLDQTNSLNSNWWFVSTHDHLNHHRKSNGNYGAPVFHFDRIFARMNPASEINPKDATAKLQ